MNLQRIKALKLAHPFRQFYILLDDGKRILVDAPESVGVAPDGSRMGISTGQGMVLLWPDRVKDVDVMPAPLRAAE
jgi:hypothetical protein